MIKLNVDCLNLIFHELLQTDKKSLHSCLLVNIEWCNLVVPILWKNYGYLSYESEKKLSNTILSCLSSSSKKLLLDNNIKLPSTILSKPLMFNYISFCKFIEAEFINEIIGIMFKEVKFDEKLLLEQEIYKLFISQCKNIEKLQWSTRQHLTLFPGASTCFSQLYTLHIDFDFVDSEALDEMAQICKDLHTLTIDNCSRDYPGLVSLINSQRNLKNVLLHSYPHVIRNLKEIGKALARKGHTIDYLTLYPVNVIPPSLLTSLINLKYLSICKYEHKDISNDCSEEELQHYLAISEFPELQFLDVNVSCFKELATLIEKTKGNILKVTIHIRNETAENTGMLIKAIANNCPKIESLFTYLEPKDFIHVKSLLLNCRNLIRLSFYSLHCFVNENDNIGDELLDILTKFSPKSLTEVTISEDWKCSIDAFKRFFESCRERTLLHFNVIYNCKDYITEGHKTIIRQYINEKVIRWSNCV